MNVGRLGVPVRLILDRSALLAYTSMSVAVGETLHEVVHDGGARFGVPTAVLAEAHAQSGPDEQRWLADLVALDACAVLPLFGHEWSVLAALCAALGRIDLAMSARASLVCAAPILTAEALAYDIKAGPDCISID